MRCLWVGMGLIFLSIPMKAVSKENSVPIEVLVEITEIDHSKATSLGAEWPDEMGWSLDPLVRITDLKASLHFMLEEGAAEILCQSQPSHRFRNGGHFSGGRRNSLRQNSLLWARPYV